MFKKILVVIDEMPVSQAAIQLGHRLATSHGAEVVHVALVPSIATALTDATSYSISAGDEFQVAAMAQAQAVLDQAMLDAERSGVVIRSALTLLDGDAHAIAEAAKQRLCDLIVVATADQNAVVRLLTRNLVPGLITAAGMPVLVCKGLETAAGHAD